MNAEARRWRAMTVLVRAVEAEALRECEYERDVRRWRELALPPAQQRARRLTEMRRLAAGSARLRRR